MSVVYALADPATLEIRYVGKTVRTPERRLSVHLAAAARGTTPYVCAWIRSLNMLPRLVVLERDPPNLEEAEIRWIAELREAGFKLCNMTAGGDGMSGLARSLESRAKQSATAQARHHHRSVEFKQKLSDSISGERHHMFGKKHTEETRIKMSIAHKARQAVA